jgi:hypothetical protein
VFVCVEGFRLLFSETLHASTSENGFLSVNYGKACLGYINLSSSSSVSVKYDGKTTSFSSHSNSKSIQRYGFQIKENEDITLTLYTENEDERKEWIEVLTEAFTGVEHELTSKALIIPSFNDNRQYY